MHRAKGIISIPLLLSYLTLSFLGASGFVFCSPNHEHEHSDHESSIHLYLSETHHESHPCNDHQSVISEHLVSNIYTYADELEDSVFLQLPSFDTVASSRYPIFHESSALRPEALSSRPTDNFLSTIRLLI